MRTTWTISTPTASLIGALLVAGTAGAHAGDKKARAELILCENPHIVVGEAKLKEKESRQGIKEVTVEIKVKRGLTDGEHAVHIHETANCQPCGAAGGHFDPGPVGLTSPDGNHPFHAGDLVNIEGDDGKGKLKTVTTRVTLSEGPLSVFDWDGSAFIIHDNRDTFCPEGEVAGCAGGSRFACGIIRPDK